LDLSLLRKTIVIKFCWIMIVMILLFSFWYLSSYLSYSFNGTDFPTFYYAASTIIDNDTPGRAVYEIDFENKYNIPEMPIRDFIYSIPSAYIMAPLALMPYYTAKSVMIFINILTYLGGVAIALRLGGATGRNFFYLFALSTLWMPSIINLLYVQVNAVLFFLISVAILAATKNRPISCGTLLGIAAMFKLFPVAIAMVLGLKN
jgi:hypothetical protein